jgi:hypothetical protein
MGPPVIVDASHVRGLRTPSAAHYIFPKRHAGVGKKREVICWKTFLVSSLFAQALSSVPILVSNCSNGVCPLVLSPSNTRRP